MRDREQQFVADLVPVGVIDELEAVEVGKQDGRICVRPLGPKCGVFEALLKEQPVRQAGQRVVQSAVPERFRGRFGVLSRLGVQQVRGGDVGECLGSLHVLVAELAWRGRGTGRARPGVRHHDAAET